MKYYPHIHLEIREACPRDLEILGDLIRICIVGSHGQNYSPQEIAVWQAGYSDEIIARFLKSKSQVFLLQAGKVICGTIQYDPTCREIKGFYVHPNYQHRGFGTILFLYLLGQLKVAGIKYIELSSNKFYRGFYEMFSFQVLQREIVVWGGLEFEEFRMCKTLLH